MKIAFSLFLVLRHALLALLVMSLLASCRSESGGTDDSAADSPPAHDADIDTGTAEEAGSTAGCPTPTPAGSGDNQAGLVVTFGDGTTETICVSFSEDQINGYELLQRSGLTIVSEFFPSQNGYGICKISNGGSDGCNYPEEDCFCNPDGLFWAFWILENNSTWEFSQVGVSRAPVNNGDVQGQKWDGEDPPPVCTFEQICGDG